MSDVLANLPVWGWLLCIWGISIILLRPVLWYWGASWEEIKGKSEQEADSARWWYCMALCFAPATVVIGTIVAVAIPLGSEKGKK